MFDGNGAKIGPGWVVGHLDLVATLLGALLVVSSSPLSSQAGVPPSSSMSKLLAPSFLKIFQDPIPSSYTIWDHCAHELNAKSNVGYPFSLVDDLLDFFQSLLALEVLLHIRALVDALKKSNLKVKATLICNKASIFYNIL